jgi:glucose/arabinose dehydrogenase
LRALIGAVVSVVVVMVAADCGGNDDSTEPGQPTTSPATAIVGATPTSTLPQVRLTKVVEGFRRPTFVTNAGDGSKRLFVLEKSGVIRAVSDAKVSAAPFLDVTAIVKSSGNEQGLLGLAFHPRFKENGRFFIAYTAQSGDNTVAEYRASGDRGDPQSARVLLAVKDPFPNHNGGMLAFGPDGYLYMSFGDGGSAGDPNGNAQNLDSLLGKLLRIDVNSGDPYGIPKDNPFASRTGARPEIWAYGLRNPWRFSFDRQTGDVWIGDVGQNAIEEIDFQLAASKGGENYGWRTTEGNACFNPATNCVKAGLVLPIAEYSHARGCSVTGGYVYRGSAFPGLKGLYFYTDYCSGNFWAISREGAGKATVVELPKIVEGISSFGEDEAGEVYLVGDRDGALYRLALGQ